MITTSKAEKFARCLETAARIVAAYRAEAPEGCVALNFNTTPNIPKQNLGLDINKIFNAFKGQVLPGFADWQANQPSLQQLNQFTSGTEIPQLTNILNQFPDPYKTIAPLQTLLQNQPNINQTLAPIQQTLSNLPSAGSLAGPLQNIMANLPSAGSFAAPIGGVSASLQNTMQNLAPVSQLTNPIAAISQALQQRMGSLMNVAPTLRAGLATQAPIIASAGQTTRDQQQAAQQQALSTAALQGNAFGNQANLANILNQQKYKDARLQGAIQNVTGLEGIQGQDVTQRLGLGQGVTSAQQAIGALRAQDIASRLGLGQGITQAQQAQQGVFNQDAAARLGLTQGVQNIYNQDLGARDTAAQLMDQLRSADVSRQLGLTSGIQNVLGTNLAQRMGLMQGITGAITQPLTTGEQSFMALLGPLLGFGGNVFDANQNAAAAQSIAGANASSGMLSGILSALGSVAGGALMASDKRLKANIQPTGAATPEGIPIKTFNYRAAPNRRYMGVIAQDVEKKVPGAVVTMPTGHKLVNRSMIDAPFQEISKQLQQRR